MAHWCLKQICLDRGKRQWLIFSKAAYISSFIKMSRISMNNEDREIRTVQVTRYVTPLREGGSLPAITEADDGFLYVLKFKGAGQGVKALIAELIGGELARKAGLRVPELVFALLDPAYGRTEPDEEIQDLLKASVGRNLALHYLSGAITFDPVTNTVDPLLASRIVWLDAFLTNVDRTIKNTNMLVWHHDLWLIDHGASLYFHHSWQNFDEQSRKPFTQIKDHVLLPSASELDAADRELRAAIDEGTVREVVSLIPDEWLIDDSGELPDFKRNVYNQFLLNRLAVSDIFVKEAKHAREALI